MRLTSLEIAKALSLASPPVDTAFVGVSTDTRSLQPGDLFVALISDKADGHDFIAKAIELGAAGVVVNELRRLTPRPSEAEVGLAVYRVPDTQVAYGQIARAWRDKFDIPVVGVTGSVGKTTTKEMLACALAPLGPILKTEASQNNETGVPKALLRLTSEHAAAVVEMGMRGSGQIAYLCGIARPTCGVITLIGENHIELLGSADAIADAKGELIEALPEDGVAFLNAEDPYFPRLAARSRAEVASFGGSGALFTASGQQLVDGHWTFFVGGHYITLNSPARHDVSNALAAFAVAVTLGVLPEDAAAALASFEPPPMRMQIVSAQAWGGTVLNDAYNAAPAAMRGALETLHSVAGARKIAFLGDMKELGDRAASAHAEIGDVIASLGGLDALYTVGDLAALIPGATARFTDSVEAARFAAESLDVSEGDVVLVKGSRAMTMERVAEALVKRRVG